MGHILKQDNDKLINYLNKLKLNNNDSEIDEIIKRLNDFDFKYEVIPENLKSYSVVNKFESNRAIEQSSNRAIEQSSNLLIEGDNIYSLNYLLKNYKNKIDLIYIDPPYNTKSLSNLFNYNDARDDYLSFMYNRLTLAKELLNNDGFIYIHLDDNSIYHIKLMCDEIFNKNFIALLPRYTCTTKNQVKTFFSAHDYILCYYKNNLNNFKLLKNESQDYKFKDEHFNERGYFNSKKSYTQSIDYRSNSDYPYVFKGKVFYPCDEKSYNLRQKNGITSGNAYRWFYIKKGMDFLADNDFLEIKKDRNGREDLYTKIYQNVAIKKVNNNYLIEKIERTKPPSSLYFTNSKYLNSNGRLDLKKFNLNPYIFAYPKPVSLIKDIINFNSKKDAIVLDFFAGSGTTGQAVVECNNEDNGTRKFILCTNNENDICEKVTYERLKKVQEKIPFDFEYLKINVDE